MEEKKIFLDETISGTKEKIEQLVKTLASKDEEIIISFTHGGDLDDGHFEKCTLANFIDTLFSRNVSEGLTKLDTIMIDNNSVYCTISFDSYSWWSENGKRRNQLKAVTGGEQKQTKTTAKQPEVKRELPDKNAEYSIAIADLTEEGLTHIDFYQGKKVDCMSWLNAQIARHYDIKEQSVMVFDLQYQPADNDDITKWFTIDELVGQGRVILK